MAEQTSLQTSQKSPPGSFQSVTGQLVPVGSAGIAYQHTNGSLVMLPLSPELSERLSPEPIKQSSCQVYNLPLIALSVVAGLSLLVAVVQWSRANNALLAARTAQSERQSAIASRDAMQQQVDTLNQQIAELRAVPTPAPVVVPQQPENNKRCFVFCFN